jgi:hypothetical protein
MGLYNKLKMENLVREVQAPWVRRRNAKDMIKDFFE